VELRCELDEVEIVTSRSLLEIVWNNLLSNAVKFTPAGGSVFVGLKRLENNVELCVSDTGCGISPEVGAHIFEKFYQGDTSHATQGNGLGLALVKRVVDIMQGEIGVESAVGVGTTFTVRIRRNDNGPKETR
jgi:signal transduction histidine kinase